MAYATTNPRAASNPLRSVPLFRPIAVLGQAFATAHIPVDHARVLAAQQVEQARDEIGAAWEFFTEAKAALGECNRMRAQSRHDSAIYPARVVARRLSAAFGTLNKRRARFLRAHKALLAAEAAVAAPAN